MSNRGPIASQSRGIPASFKGDNTTIRLDGISMTKPIYFQWPPSSLSSLAIHLSFTQPSAFLLDSVQVLVTSYGELDKNKYLDPRTAQVAIVDHIKQVCTEVRPAADEELPSPYIEEFRYALDAEILRYVGEAYPKGVCSVYCTKGKDVEGAGFGFELLVVISAAKLSPQNFCNGSWRSIWNIEFNDDAQVLEVTGKLQVGAHYFEEGNVQLDAKHECKDTTIFQSPDDSAISIAHIIRHHETEYLASLEASYSNLPDNTFKDLRRKLPVTRTHFPWHNTTQFSLTREISKELGIGK
ncbi:F-actin-capping protein subunit alpha [Pistacia vera]|uniref:F-actin-capping protein subunit alpha n=1 Tax=Pistacia vera TaxID=55513 RepID=UPI001263216A|nr:F-actin-capping protein subunit alpha [Pistacia vera]